VKLCLDGGAPLVNGRIQLPVIQGAA